MMAAEEVHVHVADVTTAHPGMPRRTITCLDQSLRIGQHCERGTRKRTSDKKYACMCQWATKYQQGAMSDAEWLNALVPSSILAHAPNSRAAVAAKGSLM